MDANQFRRDLENKTEFIFNSLVNNVERSKLPENIFVSYFLPFFAGKLLNSDSNKIISEWVGIAGTPMAEVDIIDPSGQVLYTVPPLMDTSSINVTTGERKRLGSIMSEYELKSNHIPVVGERFLESALNNKQNEILNVPNIDQQNASRWTMIFQKYGIVNMEEQKSVQMKNHTEESDDIEWE